MKRLYGLLLMGLIFLGATMSVYAKENRKPVVALGNDLTESQKADVLSYMGISAEDLENYVVISITNDMEHTYLDSYVDPAVIGTKSLSSVLLEPTEEGSGVLVNTYNINYCTTGMYRNALLTAGLENTKVTVAAPFPISGTAALIGAIKGYEELSGKDIPDKTLDTAMDELITTGEIAQNAANSEEIEELIAYLKGKLANGDLDNEEYVRQAILEAQEKFNVTLTEEEIQKILEILKKIKTLGIDLDSLVEQASDLYDKYGFDIVEHPGEVIKGWSMKKVSGFFSGIWNGVVGLWNSIF